MQRSTRSIVLLVCLSLPLVIAFCPTHQNHCPSRPRSSLSTIYYSEKANDNFDRQELNQRLHQMRAQLLNQEYQRPPNPDLTSYEFVNEVLKALWNNYDPLPDSGFRLLVRASTKRWRDKIYESVGAPSTAAEEVVVSALGDAMSRPQNQFAILVGEGEDYVVAFPSEPIDYGDGKCWVECRLRGKTGNELYAITGWSLERRKSDGAWLVDAIDWQDFRDKFRPGIGREEWLRICG